MPSSSMRSVSSSASRKPSPSASAHMLKICRTSLATSSRSSAECDTFSAVLAPAGPRRSPLRAGVFPLPWGGSAGVCTTSVFLAIASVAVEDPWPSRTSGLRLAISFWLRFNTVASFGDFGNSFAAGVSAESPPSKHFRARVALVDPLKIHLKNSRRSTRPSLFLSAAAMRRWTSATGIPRSTMRPESSGMSRKPSLFASALLKCSATSFSTFARSSPVSNPSLPLSVVTTLETLRPCIILWQT
mmetsp:Transcript_3726/g.9610  ORF Transcript_3726/g.9610 Transcript_3726/m.9610 type:complete len:244 (+) Transcript_3726:304-1035(+)